MFLCFTCSFYVCSLTQQQTHKISVLRAKGYKKALSSQQTKFQSSTADQLQGKNPEDYGPWFGWLNYHEVIWWNFRFLPLKNQDLSQCKDRSKFFFLFLGRDSISAADEGIKGYLNLWNVSFPFLRWILSLHLWSFCKNVKLEIDIWEAGISFNCSVLLKRICIYETKVTGCIKLQRSCLQ